MVDIQSATAETRRGEKKKKKKIERNHRAKNIMSASATQGGHKQMTFFSREIKESISYNNHLAA